MQIFKAFVSKETKKYNYIIKANSEIEAKDKLHKEGYSILSLKKIDKIEDSWKKFVFKARLNWIDKSWAVIAKDIFKVYYKLVDWLKYEILEIYPEEEKNITEEEKSNLLNDLKEQYKIFKEFNTDEKKIKKVVKKYEKKENFDSKTHETFYMHKELTKTHKIVEMVLNKLKEFIDKKIILDLNSDKLESLWWIYNNFVKVKKSTNIIKLKQIWELALIKIWNILIEEIEKYKNLENYKKIEKYRLELKNINILLKKVESKQVLKEKKLSFFKLLRNFFNKEKTNKKQKDIFLDKSTSSYLKTLVLIKKYKEKSKENNKEILKKIYLFIFPEFFIKKIPKTKELLEKKENLLLRKEVIDQNLVILRKKADKNSKIWKIIIRIKSFILWPITSLLKIITISWFYIILFFSIIFILFWVKNYLFWEELKINFLWVFYFLAFFFFLYSLKFSEKYINKWFKWLFISIANYCIFLLLLFFWIINF